MEVFQTRHRVAELQGEIRDAAISGLLKTLAIDNIGHFLVTMREQINNKITETGFVAHHLLKNLSTREAVQFLKNKGVKGEDKELEKLAREYLGHAYSLNMLANYLKQNFKGDIRKRDLLPNIMDRSEYSEANWHVQQVLQAHTDNLQGQPELALIYLISLFNNEVERELVEELLKALGKTRQTTMRKIKANVLLDPKNLVAAYMLLQKQGLLIVRRTELFDLHPLVRSFFRAEFQSLHRGFCAQAHLELFEYFKSVPKKEFPETLEEMQPLFHAVAHGCAAGLQEQALDEVYVRRIKRGDKHYLTQKLGAFGDDLAVIASFFSEPWREPASNLNEASKAALLNFAGIRLIALGRLHEAVEPIEASIEKLIKQKDRGNIVGNVCNLGELELMLGRVNDAVASGERSMAYAQKTRAMFHLMSSRITLANALHQAAEIKKALCLFEESEQLQQEGQPEFRSLYSLRGFYYCDLLLGQGEMAEKVLERAKDALKFATRNNFLLDIALNKITLGRGYHDQGCLLQANHWLDHAVVGLRLAGHQDQLPRGLLARAALYRDLEKFDLAQQDLTEVWEIAEVGEMRLHIVDYHLEMARLLLASKDESDIHQHVHSAKTLIQETGYHRRDGELVELEAQVKGLKLLHC